MKKLLSLIFTFSLIFVFSLFGCSKDSSKITIYSPDGAPALALTSVMDKNYQNVQVNLVDSQQIGGFITGENPKADVCVLPINMASKLIGDGKTYKMLGTITHGNFYLLSKDETLINSNNLSSLIGKTIGVIQLKNVPGLTLKCSLENKDVPYLQISDLNNKVSDKVNLIAISNLEVVESYPVDYFLVPSPLSDIKVSKTNLKLVGSLQQLYNGFGFPQAVIVAKKSLIEKNVNFVKSFIKDLKNCNNFLKIENKDRICDLISQNLESGLTPTFNKNNLTQSMIDNSSIKFVSVKENKEEILLFIQRLKEIDSSSVNTFNSDFFYLGDLWKKAP